MLDEIDQLMTGSGDVLYHLFEAPSLAPGFAIIGIANSLDLTERFLPRLKLKQMAPTVLHFQAYRVDQVKAILKKRVEAVKERIRVEEVALELCCRKVVAVGDIRKGLDYILQVMGFVHFLRKAIEKAEKAEKSKSNQIDKKEDLGKVLVVSVGDMVQVMQESTQITSATHKLKGLNAQSKAILLALYASHIKNRQVGQVRSLFNSQPRS